MLYPLLLLLVLDSTFVSPAPQGGGSEERDFQFCSSYEEFDYFCVPYYQCDTCDTIIVDGTAIFDPRGAEVDGCPTSKLKTSSNSHISPPPLSQVALTGTPPPAGAGSRSRSAADILGLNPLQTSPQPPSHLKNATWMTRSSDRVRSVTRNASLSPKAKTDSAV